MIALRKLMLTPDSRESIPYRYQLKRCRTMCFICVTLGLDMDLKKADMASGSDPQGPEVSNESSMEQTEKTPAGNADSVNAALPQPTTVRRKRRRRNFAPASTEFSRTHAGPTYVPPAPDLGSEKRRRRYRRRSNRNNYRRIFRIAMYVAVHIVFITFLIFLWMKISAKVNE